MSQLRQAFCSFSATLVGPEGGEGNAHYSLAKEFLEKYPDDPAFWLHYARLALNKDDFQEASLALETMARCLANTLASQPEGPSAAAVRGAISWWQLRCRVDMLKRAARGNPSLQGDLIQALQRLTSLSRSELAQNLSTALAGARESKEEWTPAGPWPGQLKRLSGSMATGADAADLQAQEELLSAFMGAARYPEAEQLLQEPRYLALVTEQGEMVGGRPWHALLLEWLHQVRQDPLQGLAPFTTSGPRYVLPIVVWGDPYLDSLERFTLPSLLAPGNLPYLQGVGEVRLVLFTTAPGAQRLERMPVLAAVRQLVGVDIVTFPAELTDHRHVYLLMSTMHLTGMEIAKASRAHFLFLAPDLVFAEDFLRGVEQRLRQGAEVVFVAGLILQMEGFEVAQQRLFPAENGVVAIPPQSLLTLGLRHLHPFVRRNYTYTPNAHRPTAAVFLWPLGNGGEVVHGYHHTPFLISAQALARFDGSLFMNLDGDFLPKIIRSDADLAGCVLITDPREAAYFELSRHRRFDNPVGSDLGEFDLGEFDLGRLARWGILLGPVAKWLFPQKICFEPEEKDPSDPAYEASSLVVEAIIAGRRRQEQESAYLAENLKDSAHG